jgi:methionine-rich copper-binding protein CopC
MIAAAEGDAGRRRAPGRRPHHLRRSRALFAALLATLLGLASNPTQAEAHARLERAQPANDATVAAPSTIELWFNELLDDAFNDVAVYRAKPDGSPADDANLATAKPRVDDNDRTHLTTPVGALAPGAYVVHYKVLSRDGHSARGRVLFRVAARS